MHQLLWSQNSHQKQVSTQDLKGAIVRVSHSYEEVLLCKQ